jgi:hypothetical protein
MGDVVTLVRWDRKRQEQEGYFGLCPACRAHDGYLNVGPEHVFVCDVHRTKWHIGSNLFSSWQDETEAEWDANAMRLTGYTEIVPVRPDARPVHDPWQALSDVAAWLEDALRLHPAKREPAGAADATLVAAALEEVFHVFPAHLTTFEACAVLRLLNACHAGLATAGALRAKQAAAVAAIASALDAGSLEPPF